MADEQVTIQIPGISDVIKIPVLDTVELKQQRVQRMLNAKTPIPEGIQWIPDAINFLDDAQDTLMTLLLAGKLTGLLARIPARFIPALGWLLAANDILNLANTILGAALGSRFPKRDMLEGTKRVLSGRSGRVTAANQLLKGRFPWLPFVLQGGQVLHNYTGYGLQLGTIMGAANDTFWATIRAMQGQRVKVVGPPPADPLVKAARYLSQQWLWPWIRPALTQNEIKLAVTAASAAGMALGESIHYRMTDERLDAFAYSDMTGLQVWNQQSLEAMAREGIQGEILRLKPGNYTWAGDSVSSSVRDSIALDPYLDEVIANTLAKDGESGAVQSMYDRAMESIWDTYGDKDRTLAPLNTPWERLLSRQFHENVFPPWIVEPCPDASGTLNKPIRERTCRWWTTQIIIPKYVKDPIRLPRLYPPLVYDPNWQIFWWLTITLAIKCRRPYQFGLLQGSGRAGETHFSGTVGVLGTVPGFSELATASMLVWGNVWSRNLSKYDVEKIDREKIVWCIADANTQWPKIEGDTTSRFAWDAIRQLLPEPGDVGTGAEFDWNQDMTYDPMLPPVQQN